MAHTDPQEECNDLRERIGAIKDLFDKSPSYSVPVKHRREARHLMKELKERLKARRGNGDRIYRASVHVTVRWNSIPNQTWWDELSEAAIDLTDLTQG